MSLPVVGYPFETHAQTTVVLNGRNFTTNNTYTLVDSGPIVAEIEPMFYVGIAFILQRAGIAVQEGYRMYIPEFISRFNEIRTLLPSIRLSFPTGNLVLKPEDYTEIIAEDRCRMLITSPEFALGDRPLRMNPLAFKGLNVRFTQDRILFCESAVRGDIF